MTTFRHSTPEDIEEIMEIIERALYSQRFIICNSNIISAKAVEIQTRIAQHVSPEKIHVSENPRVILTMVRAGYGCSILPGGAFCGEGVACVPLKNTPRLSYGIAYHKKVSHTVLKGFLDAVSPSK